MVDKPAPTDVPPNAVPTAGAGADGTTPAPGVPRRPPGHRGADMRDTVGEMAERAQLISQEAGSKVAAAMKDVISAAAGIAGALAGMGVPDEEAKFYENEFRTGRTLVTVNAGAKAPTAHEVLERQGGRVREAHGVGA